MKGHSMNWNEHVFCWVIERNPWTPCCLCDSWARWSSVWSITSFAFTVCTESCCWVYTGPKNDHTGRNDWATYPTACSLTLTFLTKPGSHRNGKGQLIFLDRLSSVTTKSSVLQGKILIVSWTKPIALCHKDWSIIWLIFQPISFVIQTASLIFQIHVKREHCCLPL